MGTKRIGLARMEALMENLKRELAMGAGSEMILDSLGLSEAGVLVQSEKASTGTAVVLAAHSTNYTATVTQPAGTYLKELICIPAGNITTAAGGTDDLDIDVGTSAAGGQIYAASALMDGASVAWLANTPLHVISSGLPNAANAFARIKGGPATSEALKIGSAISHSVAARTLHVNFRPLNTNLVAHASIKVIAIFASI